MHRLFSAMCSSWCGGKCVLFDRFDVDDCVRHFLSFLRHTLVPEACEAVDFALLLSFFVFFASYSPFLCFLAFFEKKVLNLVCFS